MSKLAIHGGTPVRKEPFTAWPVFDESESLALQEVLESRNWTSSPYRGDNIPARKLAERFALYHDTQYGVATSSGTGALQIAFAAAGLQPGDEVIVPPNTFVATVTPILHLGAIPVFVDIEPETLTINPSAIEAAITDRTRAIVPVHLAGYPCDMDRINEIAVKYGLKVIADACHAHGSEWKGVKVGALADLSAFSFQQDKNVTSGEGGVVVTNNHELFELCFKYHNDGRGLGDNLGVYEVQGWNFRISGFQAALLMVQFDRLDQLLTKKTDSANYIAQRLREIEGLRFPHVDQRMTRLSHLYPRLIYNSSSFDGISPRQFAKALRAEGVPASVMSTYMLYKHPLFVEKRFFSDAIKQVDYTRVNCPVAESTRGKSIYFNHSVLLSDRQALDDFTEAIYKVTDHIDDLRE